MIQSDLLNTVAGLQHGFGDIEDPIPFETHPVWQKKASWNQVHGVDCGIVTQAGQSLGDVDASITHVPGLPVSARSADCVPLLAVKGSSILAIHAGWRGVLAGIVPKVLEPLTAKNWKIAIGPHIRHCCFEVGPEVIDAFKKRERGLPPDWRPQENRIDLGRIIGFDLMKLGVPEFDYLGLCTKCAQDAQGNFRFHSYRREKDKTRQMSTAFFE